MSDSEKPIGLMVRLPADLHRAVVAFSKGNAKRPQTSLNNTIVFVLRAGLAALEKAESTSGQWEPELLEAA